MELAWRSLQCYAYSESLCVGDLEKSMKTLNFVYSHPMLPKKIGATGIGKRDSQASFIFILSES